MVKRCGGGRERGVPPPVSRLSRLLCSRRAQQEALSDRRKGNVQEGECTYVFILWYELAYRHRTAVALRHCLSSPSHWTGLVERSLLTPD
jgi:hypothetical protein